MKVELRKYETSDLEILDQYVLPQVQQSYTVLPRQWMENKIQEDRHPVTIWYDGKPIGFFVLDVSNDRFNYCENEKSILLRALSVNPDLQGKGIGKLAMIQVTEFVRNNFPVYDEIVFGVNENNINAYNLYVKCGFEDTGNKYLGGKNGPQLIMRKNVY